VGEINAYLLKYLRRGLYPQSDMSLRRVERVERVRTHDSTHLNLPRLARLAKHVDSTHSCLLSIEISSQLSKLAISPYITGPAENLSRPLGLTELSGGKAALYDLSLMKRLLNLVPARIDASVLDIMAIGAAPYHGA
jgi:hypothetical protein